MAKVVAKVYEGNQKESLESLLRRFKKKVATDQIMEDMKKREYFVSPSLKKKLKREQHQKLVRREESKRLASEEKFRLKLKRAGRAKDVDLDK